MFDWVIASFNQRQFDKVVELLRGQITSTEDFRLRVVFAASAAELGKFQEALSALEFMPRNSIEHCAILTTRSNISLMTGNAHAALREARLARALGLNRPEPIVNELSALIALDRKNAAQELLNELPSKLDPTIDILKSLDLLSTQDEIIPRLQALCEENRSSTLLFFFASKLIRPLETLVELLGLCTQKSFGLQSILLETQILSGRLKEARENIQNTLRSTEKSLKFATVVGDHLTIERHWSQTTFTTAETIEFFKAVKTLKVSERVKTEVEAAFYEKYEKAFFECFNAESKVGVARTNQEIINIFQKSIDLGRSFLVISALRSIEHDSGSIAELAPKIEKMQSLDLISEVDFYWAMYFLSRRDGRLNDAARYLKYANQSHFAGANSTDPSPCSIGGALNSEISLLLIFGMPRSGKSTLAKHIAANSHYVNLDELQLGDPSQNRFVENCRLLAELHRAVIITVPHPRESLYSKLLGLPNVKAIFVKRKEADLAFRIYEKMFSNIDSFAFSADIQSTIKRIRWYDHELDKLRDDFGLHIEYEELISIETMDRMRRYLVLNELAPILSVDVGCGKYLSALN